MAHATGSTQRLGSVRHRLPYVGLVTGVWAAVAPYTLLGPDLNAAAKNEFVDHVVPGLLILVLSAVMIARARSTASGATFPLLAGFGVALAGLWMTATHLPLVKDARNDLVATDIAAWHTIPGLVVMALGAVWAASYWSEAGPEPATPAGGDQSAEADR